jgi:hypothetical protein
MFNATTPSDCYECHTDDKSKPSFFHSSSLDNLPSANCFDCHNDSIPGNDVVHDINVSAFNRSVHRNINANATKSNPSWPDLVKACWGCHRENPLNRILLGLTLLRPAGDVIERTARKERWRLQDITTHTFVLTAIWHNVSNAPTVSEHFLNGTNLKATSKNASIILSCKTCHNLVEMIVENGDIEEASFDADGDGINGTNLNFYHYGKNRSDLRVTRNSSSCGDGSNTNCSKLNTFPANTNYTYTNCSYCHQNTTTSFELAMNDTGHKSMLNHTDSSVGPYCTDCHIAYDGNTTVRIHDQQLVKPFRNYTVEL